MTNTDLQFLKELQEELRTQETDYQAAPRFWVIKDYREVPAHPDYDNCRTSYFHNDGDHTEFNNVDDLKEFLEEYYLDEDLDGSLKELLEDDDTTFESLWELAEEGLNEDGFFSECPVKLEEFLVPSTMFLTNAEAQRHLELNHYHYSRKAHTYAMTAWRAPKVERLLKVLETFDWDCLQVAEVPK